MPIDIGDAVLNFIADTTQLDAAYNKVGTEGTAKLAPASAAVEKVGTDFEVAGAAAAVAGEEMVIATTEAAEGAEKMSFNMSEAKASVGLLGEATGIHLPRHIRGFVAELPGVGIAMETAFSGIAVFFLIEALVKGIEKIKEFMETAQRIAEAWEAVDKVQKGVFESLEDHLLRSQEKTAELAGNHLEALRLKLQIIDRTSLGHLEQEFEKLIAEADKAFLVMDRSWFTKLLGFEGSEEAKTKFDDIAKEVNKALDEKTPESFAKALQLVAKAGDDVDKKLQELEKRKNAVGAEVDVNTGVSSGAAVDPRTIESYKKYDELLKDLTKDIVEQQKATEGDKGNARLEDDQKQAAAAKKNAEAQIKLNEEVAKSRLELDKQIEKGADDVSKAENFRLTQQLKEEEKLTTATLKGYIEQEKAAETSIDGQIEARKAQTASDAEFFKSQYDRGILTRQQYLAALKALYAGEVAELKAMLTQKENLVIQQLQNEAALQGKTLTIEQAKETAAYQAIENQKVKITTDADAKLRKLQDQLEKDQEKSWKKMGPVLAKFQKELEDTANVGKAVGASLGEAIAATAQAYATGAATIGQAVQQVVDAEIQGIAKIAEKKGAEKLAEATGEVFHNPAAAAEDFASAALWFALAGGLSAGAHALSGSGKGSSGGGSGSGNAPASVTSAASQSAANPGGGQNVARLAAGGLVTAPTLAIVGDSRSGGGSREAILPLDDPHAMREIAAEIAQHLSGSQAAITHITIQGMVSSNDARQFIKQVNSDIKGGKIRLTSRNSYRLTKRG